MEINLNPFQDPQNTPKIDLSGQGVPVPSLPTAAYTAAKASFGLGDVLNKPYDEIHSSIAAGQEGQVRQEAASAVDANKAKRKQTALTQAVSAGASNDDLSKIVGLPTQTDPSSVFEEYSASKYFQPLFDNPGTQIDDAYKAINAGVSNLAYKNYAITRLQKSMDNYKNESWLGWGEDQLKNLSQIYTEYKLRGGYNGTWSDTLGHDLSDQIDKAYQMPFDQFKQWYDQKMDQFDHDNPSLALTFGSAVAGQSLRDVQDADASTLIGVPSDLSAVGGVAADAVSAINKVRSAVQGVVKSTDIIDPNLAKVMDAASGRGSADTMKDVTSADIKAAQAAGHGDVGEAAVQDVAQTIAGKFNQQENVNQEALKSIPRLFKPEETGKPSTGTDIVNRIMQRADQRQVDLEKGVETLLKVNRTPVVVASEDLARSLRAWIKNKYAGPNSTVLDTTGINLLYDAPSNTYHLNIDIANHNGEYFANEAEAVTHAEMYGIGLDEPANSTRRYWDDEATAAAFQVDHLKKQIAKYEPSVDKVDLAEVKRDLKAIQKNYKPGQAKSNEHIYLENRLEELNKIKQKKNQFKPKEYYSLKKQLDEQNERKKRAWANRAGAYWQPNQPIEAKLGKVTLEKQGLGWYIQGWVPLDETDSVVRDALLKMPGAWSGPASKAKRQGTLTPYLEDLVTGTQTQRTLATVKIFADSILGGEKGEGTLQGLRTPEETLSPEENVQRKVAVFTPSKLMNLLFKEDTATLQKIPSKYLGDFRRVLVANQTMPDPVTHEDGYFFNSVSELEHFYNAYIGRFPTQEETEGYFAYTGMYETERALRALSLLRNKWRSAVESIQIEVGPNRQQTPWFDAVRRTELPTAFEKSPVYLALEGDETVKASGAYTQAVKDGVKEGKYQVWELWNREDRPFHGVSDKIPHDTEPRYVITDRVTPRPIDPDAQVPRRGGGHWVFPYDHYMRQANTYFDPVTKQWIYKGDTTLFPFQNVALGRKITSQMNEIQNLIREGLVDEARDLVQYRGYAGLNFDKDILGAFKGYKDPETGKFIPPRLNLHENFKLVPADKTIMSIDNELMQRYESLGGIQDTTRYGNMARNHVVEFTGERDAWNLHTIDDAGTPNNPIFSYRPAQLADPIDVINRGITRIANSMWLDDIKYFASEHWYQTFKNQLNIDKGGSPFYHFINPEWKTGVQKDNPLLIQLAMSSRKKSMDLVRMPSPIATKAHKVMSEAAGAIYNMAGAQAYNYFRPLSEIPTERSPVRALRSLTADLKIGLGSVPAFLMQLSAFVNIMAFEPRYVAAGLRATLLDEYARFMPQHIDYLDQIASKVNLRGYGRPLTPVLPGGGESLSDKVMTQAYWKPGHFTHIWRGLSEKTDYGKIGKEHALQDFALRDRYMRTKWDTIKYWGGSFFREAAQFVRRAGWYTSALKWIEENEGRLPQTRDEWAQIQSYAANLDHDMNRAANSSVNTGFMSIPAQFYTYDRNIAEDMWGKRFNRAQKARMFILNSIMWGVPYGGLGLMGLPLGYLAHKEAVNQGYIAGDNIWASTAMEGVPGLIGAYLSGEGDPHKGTWYDFSRFGVRGWGMLSGLFSDDPRWYEFLGAMPSAIINTALRSRPLWRDFAGLIHGINTSTPTNVPGVGTVPARDGDFKDFNPTSEDFADLFKEWSAFSYGHRLLNILRYGVWMSNNNTPLLEDVKPVQGIVNFLTGLEPSRISDIGTNFGILGDRKAQKESFIREASRNYNLALLSAQNNPNLGENKEYQAYMRKLSSVIRLAPLMDRNDILRTVMQRNRPLVDTLEEQMGKVMATPADQARFKRQLELQGR